VTGVLGAVVATGTQVPTTAEAATAPVGQGFTLNSSDLSFILKQIKIAEAHATKEGADGAPVPGPALFGNGSDQIASPLLPYGLRTVDGSLNNGMPGQAQFGAAQRTFPRMTDAWFRPAEMAAPFGPPNQATSYAQKKGNVVDSQPRVISNLIVDQTATNPAAVSAAGRPHRHFDPQPSAIPCESTSPNVPAGCTPPGETLFIPNVTTDVGLSPPYNSWFTLFGQFFDHGLDSTAKSGGTVFVPLKDDDPLIAGDDRELGTADDLPPAQRFMVMTRSRNQPGPDGILGDRPSTPEDESADDVQNATNTDTPWVDQSQTYTSHSSHQVFLREYANNADGKPMATGKMIEGAPGGMATWAGVKQQAAELLGVELVDADVLNIPMVAADEYGRFLRGPDRGLPQIVTAGGLVEGDTADPVAVPEDAKRIDVAFLDDIAHYAVPKPAQPAQGPTPAKPALTPDEDTAITGADGRQDAGTYDDEMLDTHFIAGDGRVNENIGLTAIHQVFHSEHNRLTGQIKDVLTADTSAKGVAALAEWKSTQGSDGWNGERLFQAARFVTEMEYQHLVFEEFARKVQPLINPFNPFTQSDTGIDPAIKAEFAHAVYRFGHSMLTETVARTNADGTKNDIPLLDAFLNPPSYYQGSGGTTLTPEQAAGSIAMGMTDQVGNELDEFVTEALRNNLLGLPLDLATLNLARAREAGVPSLNNLRKDLYRKTGESSLKPYSNWVDFGLSLKHGDSVVNFMAAYGQHPSIKDATTLVAKRKAAQVIYDDNLVLNPDTPADASDFVNSDGAWANDAAGMSKTGLDDVDLWVGGLAESQNLFGGLLGSTFNYVFERQMTDLQDGDRLYYLSRTSGLNLRTQLEGNSFAELIMRNTDAAALKAEVFGTADCEFELKNLAGTGNLVLDDPASECDESKVLIRMRDGTIRYRQNNLVDPPGINAQNTFNGTSDANRIWGGVDNDTFWGNDGDDVIEGSDGGDTALGGNGDDIITDSAGDDVHKGGDGDDAIDAGPGLDIIMSGNGKDFTNGGLNENETFAGEGDDFALAGDGPDTVFGGGGDDWEEGGNANDLLQGDSGAPFFDDVNVAGHDVLIGGSGEDDYDAEGGDDIMVAGPGIERNHGTFGFDWATQVGDEHPADSDLTISIAAGPAALADRFLLTEALSGWDKDDVLRGDDIVPSEPDTELFGPAGANALDADGIKRIDGLAALLPAGATGFDAGNILIGGAGSDTIEGRGADDIIDGDAWLNVRLSVRTDPADPATETRTVGSMKDLQDDVFAGRLDPGNIVIVREIKTAPSGSGVDTAVFSGPFAEYDLSELSTTSMTVAHVTNPVDGTDTLRNIERLVFADRTIVIRPVAALAPNQTFAARSIGTTSAAQIVTLSNTGNAHMALAGVELAGANPGDYAISSSTCGASLAAGANCVIRITFNPTAVGTRAAILRATNNSGNIAGSTQEVTLTGVGTPAVPVNSPATGKPVLSDTTPQAGQRLTFTTSAIADANGLGTFRYQWQRTGQLGTPPWTNISGATGSAYDIPGGFAGLGAVGRRYRVVVSFNDGAGNPESVTSNDSAPTTLFPNLVGAAPSGPVSPASGPAQGSAPAGPSPARLRAGNVSVSANRVFPIVVTADIPAGAEVITIAVFRLGNGTAGGQNARRAHRRTHVATMVRTTAGGNRNTFRLTGKKLRNMKPGRYLVKVRVGKSRTDTGPATTRTIRVKKAA